MSWRDATAFWRICVGKEKSEKQKAPKKGQCPFAENAALAFYYKKIL